MKSRIHRKRILPIRPLKPKSMLPMHNLQIQSLSFHHHPNGTTYMTINPDLVTLDSKELISVLEEKRDRIEAGNNGYFFVRDILTAIHRHPTKSDNTEASRNGDINNHHNSNLKEPKRPANAFICYNIALRKKVKTLFPNYSNSDVSKIVGGMWKSVGKSEKDEYIKQAVQCRKQHKEKFPNFEYNIKREAAFNYEGYSDLQTANDWENYLDWCIQNFTNESSVGALQYSNELVINPTSAQMQTSVMDPQFECAKLDNISSQNLQMSSEWNEVCHMVSRFFPGASDQNETMDEQFWRSLDNLDLLNDLSIGSSPRLCESLNESHFYP
uniref:High mobility group domain protein n=1 Tax=Mucor circinelloides TaxID=36080 RepID=B5TRH8_MUCCI|nr:high mobility group domain protein [Mucor circinelloides]